ncbi:hypothetical protein ASPCAL12394 [Aspergillus calidoustus]|uniref:Uncharacterized protein n=1 Tax=Aspergillus calidoustus TaxID=454130 RepID=A0A0U5GDF1_ASPCI|nr:hypothetical protein ASPCAL12394 [Aspergillus calidoustus]
MPSATSIFDQTITNWGPLPTAYNLPVSCASSTTWVLAHTLRPEVPLWHDCASETQLCLPSPTDPSALETLIEANEIPGDGYLGAYYSPGASCPGGWKTVGAATRGERTISRSGFLATATGTTATADEDWVRPMFYNNDEAIVHLLDVGEMAVWCCPESMTALLEDGACYSTLPSFRPSTACRTFFTRADVATYTIGFPGEDGQTTDGELYVITAMTTGTVETTTLSRGEATDWIAYSQQPALRFVQGVSVSIDSGEGSVDSGGDSGVDDRADPSESSSAGKFGGALGSLVASVALGAALALVR